MSVDATLLLADSANISSTGSANALGLGWRIIGPSPLRYFTVLVIVTTSDADLDKPVELRLELRDAQGRTVVQGPSAEPVISQANIQPAAHEIRPDGMPGQITLQANFQNMIVEPGFYTWYLTLNGEQREQWRLLMYVRSSPEEFPATAVFGD